jgi:hypothetical protein
MWDNLPKHTTARTGNRSMPLMWNATRMGRHIDAKLYFSGRIGTWPRVPGRPWRSHDAGTREALLFRTAVPHSALI